MQAALSHGKGQQGSALATGGQQYSGAMGLLMGMAGGSSKKIPKSKYPKNPVRQGGCSWPAHWASGHGGLHPVHSARRVREV